MSVTIDGIKGYEYQYKTTVLIALLDFQGIVELFVESVGSEDITLRVQHNGVNRIIEIQVKREKSNLDIFKIVEWLCHFQERRSDNSLLQRVINDQNTTSIFITHSRCSDSTVVFRKEIRDIDKHNKIRVSKEWKADFISKLGSMNFGDTTLMKERTAFSQKQATEIKANNNWNIFLDQIIIWEEIYDEKIDKEILTILNTKYNIAQSNTRKVYLELLEIVRDGRDAQKDIFEDIHHVVKINTIDRPTIFSNYKLRIEESALIDSLQNSNILLLTGISQCGKSELAKKVATVFFDEGYDYRITDDIEEIKRFFLTNSSDKKIAILEDPWGHIDVLSDFEERKIKISNIISNLQSHTKLVVTSRIEILFEIFGTNNLSECKILNILWKDLTITDSNIINKFWSTFSEEKSLPKSVSELVSRNILNTSGNQLLQIGQLNYLINEETNNLLNKSYTEIEHIARRNAKEIANSIQKKNEYYAEVVSILAMCSSTIYSINISDLSYILSENTEKISIIDKSVFYSSFNQKDPVFPKYPEGFTLSLQAKEALEYLEERQLIYIVKNEILFSHPNYCEAGRHLFFSKSESKQTRKLIYYKKSISCLNPHNAYFASKQLQFVYSKIKPNFREEVINYAFTCLDSIFPSVEDNALVFLLSFIESFNEDQREELIHNIQSGGTGSSHIYWHNENIPFISNTSGSLSLFREIDKTIIEEVRRQLADNRLPNPYNAWVFIESLKFESSISTPITSINLLLQYNEAFIRKKVVYEIFKRLNESNKSVLNDIFNDEHPSVVFSAIRASFINWFTYSEDLKMELLSYIKQSFDKKDVSIRACNLISTFSIDYGPESIFTWEDFNKEQKKELWSIWGELYPLVIPKLPLGVFINTARFGYSMGEAIKYLNVDVGIKVLEAWFHRIDYQIKGGRILDEYEMAIADDLMELTGSNHIIREHLFSMLIDYNDTNFILSNLKWIVEFWDKLDISEREQIFKLIKSNRIDIRWIKAILLNSHVPIDEIWEFILGEPKIYTKEVDYIVSKFPPQLLSDCINVFYGSPQPLWWLAVHNKNPDFWNKIIKLILYNETHINFDFCLNQFLSDGVNGFTSDWSDWETIWTDICSKIVDKQKLTNTLIYNIANCSFNIDTTNRLWNILFATYLSENKKEEVIQIIIDNIEILQNRGHAEDLYEVFGKEFIMNEIIPKLVPDSIFIIYLEVAKTNPFFDEESSTHIITTLSEIAKVHNIRFSGTFNYFKNLINKSTLPLNVKELLKEIPNHIDEVAKEKLDKIDGIHNYKLSDWIGNN